MTEARPTQPTIPARLKLWH